MYISWSNFIFWKKIGKNFMSTLVIANLLCLYTPRQQLGGVPRGNAWGNQRWLYQFAASPVVGDWKQMGYVILIFCRRTRQKEMLLTLWAGSVLLIQWYSLRTLGSSWCSCCSWELWTSILWRSLWCSELQILLVNQYTLRCSWCWLRSF